MSRSTVWRFFARRAITFKKKTAHACEQERPDVARRRQAWRAGQPDLDPAQLVFVDETGTSTKMARRSGRAPRGERCRAPVPHGHWQTTTFVGALRVDGMTAPMVLDGPMHGPAFRTWVERLPGIQIRPTPLALLRKKVGQRPTHANALPKRSFQRSVQCCRWKWPSQNWYAFQRLMSDFFLAISLSVVSMNYCTASNWWHGTLHLIHLKWKQRSA